MRQLDLGFLRRVYKGSGAIFLVALLVSLRWARLDISLGVACGWLLAIGLLVSWQVVAGLAFDRERPRPGLAGLFLVLKLPLIGAIVWLLISKQIVEPIGFAAGFMIPQVTIVLLTVGGISDRSRASARTTLPSPAPDGGT